MESAASPDSVIQFGKARAMQLVTVDRERGAEATGKTTALVRPAGSGNQPGITCLSGEASPNSVTSRFDERERAETAISPWGEGARWRGPISPHRSSRALMRAPCWLPLTNHRHRCALRNAQPGTAHRLSLEHTRHYSGAILSLKPRQHCTGDAILASTLKTK